MSNDNGGRDIAKIIALCLSIGMAIATSASTALAVERGRQNNEIRVQVDKMVVCIDAMKEVDVQLAQAIATSKAERVTDIALINQRIGIVIALLDDLKQQGAAKR